MRTLTAQRGQSRKAGLRTGLGGLLSFFKATNPEPSFVCCMYDPGYERCFDTKYVRKVLFRKHLLQFDDT